MIGIEQVVINFFEDDSGDVQARITVKSAGVRASCIDESEAGFFAFWGAHLAGVVGNLQSDCETGAATGGDKEKDG